MRKKAEILEKIKDYEDWLIDEESYPEDPDYVRGYIDALEWVLSR